MFRRSLLLATLFLAACGLDPAVPAVQDEAPLVAQAPAVPLPRGELTNAAAPLRLRPELSTVQVHSLAAPDGAHVKYLLGMMGCGISVVASGTATVQGGAFSIPYDPARAESWVSLYFQLDETCDPETSQVFEVPATLPGTVDLSVLPDSSFTGCWLFE